MFRRCVEKYSNVEVWCSGVKLCCGVVSVYDSIVIVTCCHVKYW